MLFSFKQFQQTKKSLIQQFDRQPPIDYQSQQYAHQSSAIIHQYNKLLNQVKYMKQRDKNCNKLGSSRRLQIRSAKFRSKQILVPQSATCRRRFQDSELIANNQTKIEYRNQLQQTNNQIYLTELSFNNCLKLNKKQSQLSQLSLQNTTQHQTTTKIKYCNIKNNYLTQQNIQKSVEQQQQLPTNAQQVINLRVKIFQSLNQEKYLQTEINELEQALRYYKRVNNDLQLKIEQKQKQHTIVLNSVLKKQSDLNSVDSRNKYFKQKFESTQRYFAKSLRSMKISSNSQSKICTQLIDDVTQKILTVKFYRSKIRQQKQQIQKLQEKHAYKIKKMQQNRNMHLYAQMILKLDKVTHYLKTHQYGKFQQMQSLRNQILFMSEKRQRNRDNMTLSKDPTSILFGQKSPEDGLISKNISINKQNEGSPQNKTNNPTSQGIWNTCTSNLISSNKKSLIYQHKYDDINFLQLTKQILKCFYKMVKDEQRLKRNYQYKINQMESNRKFLYQFINQKQQTYYTNDSNVQTNANIVNLNTQVQPKKDRILTNMIGSKNCSNFKESGFTTDQWTNKKKIVQLSIFSKQFSQQIKKIDKIPFIDKTSIKNGKQSSNKWELLPSSYLKSQPQLDFSIKKLEQKSRKINQSIFSIKERLRFAIKKQIKYLEKIIGKWLKFDQSAIKFLSQIVNKYIKIQSKPKQKLQNYESKQLLMQYFQNWQKYTFFIEQLHNNFFLLQQINKVKLKQLFRRVIKTKCNYPSVETQKIFVKCLKQIYKSRIQKNLQNITVLFSLGLDLHIYANKYQVLIINQGKAEDNQHAFAENTGNDYKYKLQKGNKMCVQKQQERNEVDLKNKPFQKISPTGSPSNSQKHRKRNEKKNRNKKNQSSSQQISEKSQSQNDLEVVKQTKQENKQQSGDIVSYILAFQTELNKIKNARLIGKQKSQ